MPDDAFNSKRNLLCGTLNKDLRERMTMECDYVRNENLDA